MRPELRYRTFSREAGYFLREAGSLLLRSVAAFLPKPNSSAISRRAWHRASFKSQIMRGVPYLVAEEKRLRADIAPLFLFDASARVDGAYLLLMILARVS